MKILYTIVALVAIAIIAVAIASLSGNKTTNDFSFAPETFQQDEYVDNTGEIVGGLPEAAKSEKNTTKPKEVVKPGWQTYQTTHGFEIKYPPGWDIISEPSYGRLQYPGFIVSFDSRKDSYYVDPKGKFFVYKLEKDVNNLERIRNDVTLEGRLQIQGTEKILVNGASATKLVMEPSLFPDLKTGLYDSELAIIIEHGDAVYMILNIGSDVDLFKEFYNSFKLSGLPEVTREVSNNALARVDEYLYKDNEYVYIPSAHGDSYLMPYFFRATTTIPRADPATFRPFSGLKTTMVSTYAYYRDKNNIYYFEFYDATGGQRSEVKVLKIKDIDTFEIVEGNPKIDAIENGRYVYFLGNVIYILGD